MSTRIEDGNAEVRFSLFERWADGPVVGWLGMNPSEASAAKTDPTWLRMRGFAERWGYGGQLVMNPVPYRSSDPSHAIARLQMVAAGKADGSAMRVNVGKLTAKAGMADLWILGWGDNGAAMNAVLRCHTPAISALLAGGATRFGVFGLTKSGNPIHPLVRGKGRLADDAAVFAYDHGLRSLGEPVQHPGAPA